VHGDVIRPDGALIKGRLGPRGEPGADALPGGVGPAGELGGGDSTRDAKLMGNFELLTVEGEAVCRAAEDVGSR
jgi:hypothetical protein